MGARTKLNQATFNGAFVIAAVAGLIADSVGIFLSTLGVLIALSIVKGAIRFSGTQSPHR